jgi:hypothetical protein
MGAGISNILAEAMWFPVAHLPVNIATGVGWGSGVRLTRLADTRKGNTSVSSKSGNGVAWMLAGGWDFFAGKGANLSLQLRYDGSYSSNLGADHAGTVQVWFNFY